MMELWQQKMLDFDLVWSVIEGGYARADLLLSAGADADATDIRGRTCVWHAVQLRNPTGETSQLGVAIVNLLQRYGADIENVIRRPDLGIG